MLSCLLSIIRDDNNDKNNNNDKNKDSNKKIETYGSI